MKLQNGALRTEDEEEEEHEKKKRLFLLLSLSGLERDANLPSIEKGVDCIALLLYDSVSSETLGIEILQTVRHRFVRF